MSDKMRCAADVYQAVKDLNAAILRTVIVPGMVVDLEVERNTVRGGAHSVEAKVVCLVPPKDPVPVAISEPA